MPQFSILFSEIREGVPNQYVREKISAMFGAINARAGKGNYEGDRTDLTPELLDSYVENVTAQIASPDNNPDAIPLAPEYDLSTLPDSNRAMVLMQRDCLINEVDQTVPLLDGEHVEKDLATYLNEEWEGYPAYTIVLRRTTNLATTHYIVPLAQADLQNLIVKDVAPEPEAMTMKATASSTIDFGEAAKQIAKGLAGLAPAPLNTLGALLINAFWPTSSKATTDWNEVYENLQLIVKNGLAQNNVDVASAKVKGFVMFIDTEYVPLKNDPKRSRKELMDALAPYDTAFFMDIVNIFMFTSSSDEKIASASLANFMLGANMHIALNQERALVDPQYVDDPANSAYAQTAARLAINYAEYARKTAPTIKKQRLKQITDVKSDSSTHCSGGAAAHCTTNSWYWFEDKNNGYKSQTYSQSSADKNAPDARSDAEKARKQYYNNISRDMDNTLKTQVYDVAAYWDQVAKNPVNTEGLLFPPPTSAPVQDPQHWAQRTPFRDSKKWVPGYHVRYAVSFVYETGESVNGPWWSPNGADSEGYLNADPWALPVLMNIPTDPNGIAKARKIHRQFKGFDAEVIGTINNNTDTRFQDSTL